MTVPGAAGTAAGPAPEPPLAGLRVVELGHVAAGPFAAMLLGDMGADVVKLEPPTGDGLRQWAPHRVAEDGQRFSLNFASLNRNKRSVVVDLKADEGLALARRLVAEADVLIENYRPGVLERLGLGFRDVAALNDAIVYCSISGYGSTGPAASSGAYDVIIQAEGGLMSVTGHDSTGPAKSGVPVADFVAAQYAAFTIVCARSRPGRREPVYLDCSMIEALLSVSALQTSEYWGTGVPPARLGTAHSRNAPYQAFQASDRLFTVAAGNDGLWRRLCAAIDDPGLADDPRFRTQQLRVANVEELAKILDERFGRHSADHWVAALREVGVPCGVVNDFAQALASPQLAHRRFVRPLDMPFGEPFPTTVLPLHVDGVNAYSLRRPPLLGEHTEQMRDGWVDVAPVAPVPEAS